MRYENKHANFFLEVQYPLKGTHIGAAQAAHLK